MAGFKKAKAEQAALKIGLYGPPGSGKTLTTLLCLEGLAQITKKRVAFVDTERGTDFYTKDVPERAVHPKAFDFDALYTRSITETTDAIYSLDPNEYCGVAIDSITHLWEAARAAYAGRTNKAGQIPFHAWAQIKKPYKDLMAFLLSSPLHVFILGREGNSFDKNDDTGEMEATGKKMKAEGETPYEPHILLQMRPEKDTKTGRTTVTAFAEKDRTGILSYRTFENPTFDTLIKPLLGLLGGKQAQVQTEDDAAAVDSEKLTIEEQQKIVASEGHLREFSARFELAKTTAEVDAVSKSITTEIKKQMTAADVSTLREKFQEASIRVKGQ